MKQTWLICGLVQHSALYVYLLFFYLQREIIDIPCEGNMFLSKLCGAKIYIINRDLFGHEKDMVEKEFQPRMEKLAEQLKYVTN